MPDDNATAEAWRRYLDDTKDFHGYDYENHEPFAWARLQEELERIRGAVLTSGA